MLPLNIRSLVMEKQKFVEDKVYIGVIDSKTNVLERVYKHIDGESHLKDRIKENIIEMMGDIHAKFETQIRYSDNYIIHKLVNNILLRFEARKTMYSLIASLAIAIHLALLLHLMMTVWQQIHSLPHMRIFPYSHKKLRKLRISLKKFKKSRKK